MLPTAQFPSSAGRDGRVKRDNVDFSPLTTEPAISGSAGKAAAVARKKEKGSQKTGQKLLCTPDFVKAEK